MKVSELITLLQAHDPDMDVVAEGCDCLNSVDRVETVDTSNWGGGVPSYCLIGVDVHA